MISKTISFFDDRLTDVNIVKNFAKVTCISLILLLILSFPVTIINSINPLKTVNAESSPIKVMQYRNSETWLLSDGSMISKIGGEAKTNFFDNYTNTWESNKITSLTGDSFKVQSGLISTLFDDDIIHYDMNMTSPVSREIPMLFHKVDKNYIPVVLTLSERTVNLSSESSYETVAGITVNDPIEITNVNEKYSTEFGDFLIKYTYKDSEPLKHTFTLIQSILNDGEIFSFTHDFELLNYNKEEIKSDKVDVIDDITKKSIKPMITDKEIIDGNYDKLKTAKSIDLKTIRLVETETNELISELNTDESYVLAKSELLTIDDFGNKKAKASIVDGNNNFLLGEIIAETSLASSWEKFKEVRMDNTQANPHIQFVYGDWLGGFELDPDTYSSNNPTVDGYTIDGNDDVCNSGSGGTTTGSVQLLIEINPSAGTEDCYFSFLDYDISSIPSTATVTDVDFIFDVGSVINPRNCDYVSMGTIRGSDTGSNIWTAINGGTVMLNNDSTCVTTGNNKSVDLGSVGNSEVQTRVSASSGFFTFGIKPDDLTVDVSDHGVLIEPEEVVGATPKPTLEITYSSETDVTFDVNNFNGTSVTIGSVTQSNTTTSRTISLNSTGFAGIFTGLSGNQNATYKDTDNMITNKTINFTPVSTITTTLNNYATSCSVTGSSNDINSKINNTDGHRISTYTTPSCNTSSVLSWNSTFTADGKSGTFQSKFIGYIQNFTAYGKTPTYFYVNGTDIPVTLSGNKLTSDLFTIGSGLSNYLLKFYLHLDPKPDIPTGLTTTPTSSSIALSWTLPNSGVTPISGHKIFRSTDGVTYSALVNNTGTNATTYTDSGLSAITYYYKVASINSYGIGSNSTVDSDTPSTTPAGSAGGGGGGATTTPSITNALLLNLTPKSLSMSLGEKRTYSLDLIWDETKEFSLYIKKINIGQTSLDSLVIVPESLPELGKQITGGKGEILFTLDVPTEQCNTTQITARCVNLKTYTIPVLVSVDDVLGTSYPDIQGTLTVTIMDKFPIGTLIIIILLLGFIYPIYRIIKLNSKKSRSPEHVKKNHDKILEKSKEIDHKKIKHNQSIFKKIKKGF